MYVAPPKVLKKDTNAFGQMQTEAESSEEQEEEEVASDEPVKATLEEPMTRTRRTLQLPQKYLERLFGSKSTFDQTRNVGPATGSISISK